MNASSVEKARQYRRKHGDFGRSTARGYRRWPESNIRLVVPNPDGLTDKQLAIVLAWSRRVVQIVRTRNLHRFKPVMEEATT